MLMRNIIFMLLIISPVTALAACSEELAALAQAGYHEDRSNDVGLQGVMQVMINRSKSRSYPYNLCDIIYQPSNNPNAPRKCAFSFTCDGIPDKILEDARYIAATSIAEKLISGEIHLDITMGSTVYFKCELYGRDKWMDNLTFQVKINEHCYYTEN